ncbi:hypothetical protein GQ55_4G324600 [Panicum hallii var. hallii]|uniref:DUF3615 domain-containing protein n=1 Tax=Panicum hallii var. hallii TaxID=1504633 RepID=A0A2T7E2E6_9POAL|nr:hypothetical protein GQ55_4G324600 [Panicum hallii var. hallii]
MCRVGGAAVEGFAAGAVPRWAAAAAEPRLQRPGQAQAQGTHQEGGLASFLLHGAADRRSFVCDAFLIRTVQHALCHYNSRHQGGEFDAVKPRPLMEARVGFRAQVRFHLNFWARSRRTNKIKRFFAEVHYKPHPPTP